MNSNLYRVVWRWHFYAGLFVLPFIVVLSLSGAVYLFKPQIERWEERAWRDIPGVAAPAEMQVSRALADLPGASLAAYRLPASARDAPRIDVKLADGANRQVFVAPDASRVLAVVDPDDRIVGIAREIHGELLLGPRGGYVVELAASWALLLVFTGLYLWWPRQRPDGRALPRLSASGRPFWRDVHAVTGAWFSGLVIILLLSGLPWTTVWADGFKAARAELGIAGRQDWTGGRGGGEHAGHERHEGNGETPATPAPAAGLPLSAFVAIARSEALPSSVMVQPPKAPGDPWTVMSDTANRPLRVTLKLDPQTGAELSRADFASRHPVDKVIGYGIAWHEGALFGWVNQAIGLLTALALVAMSVAAGAMWWRRRPDGGLRAPPAPPAATRPGFVALFVAAGVFLPLLGASLLAVWLLDSLVGLLRRQQQLRPG